MRDAAAVVTVADHDPSIVARVVGVAERRVTRAAPGLSGPSALHSAARTHTAAWKTPESSTVPTMVRPSRLTLEAPRPPMKISPVVGIQ